MKLQPDDPRLTAFALGELAGDEHARVAAAVAADPALQAAVDEINSTVAQLTAALASEPAPAVAPIELPEPHATGRHRTVREPVRARLFQFPYVAIGSLAAACFAIVFLMLNQNEHAMREAARHAAPANEPRPVALSAAATETAPTALIPDTLPLAANETRETMMTPPPAMPVLSPAENPATSIAVAVAPITPSPNTTPVAVHQTQANPPQVAGGLARADATPATATPGAPGVAPAPMAALTPTPRGYIRQAPLPPSAGDTQPPTAMADADGLFADLLTESPMTSDHLRTTFRDFGARYATNRATPAGTATSPSVAFATNDTDGTGANEPVVPMPDDATSRSADENIKTDGAHVRRLPYEEPAAASRLQDELNRRGTINQGGQIADLETQLRDLQGADGTLDSPVQDFVRDNAFVTATENPASVFPVVIDTASHVNVRRALLTGVRPSRDTVRIDELLNVHAYNYAAPPADSGDAFAASLEVAVAPWAPQHRLVRVGLKAREVAPATRPAGHFVVLVETGDADANDSQLALIKESLRQFVERLGPQDEVAIAQHNAAASLVLPTTSTRERDRILTAIDRLDATTAANGSMGLQLAYDVARAHFVAGGINRVVLLSDGDTRLGEAQRDDAVRLVDAQARVGIALSAVGFGVRDLRDSMLEQLAHLGGGEIAFVDTPRDAQRALRDRADGAFATVARNVKLQVEFNPARVHSWRLIGYEDRVFLREDFDHESLTAGTVGAGHTITALVEIVPRAAPAPSVDDTVAIEDELLSVKVRSTAPGEDAARVQQFALTDSGRTFADASGDFKFAAAVAGFGMLLRNSPHRGTATFVDVAAWARADFSVDSGGSRAEFLDLVERAGLLLR